MTSRFFTMTFIHKRGRNAVSNKKDMTVKAANLASFLEKHTNAPVSMTLEKKGIRLNIQGEIHTHDDQFWIINGNAKTILHIKPLGNWFSRMFSWPDIQYHVSVTVTLAGETVASLSMPIKSNDKLPCQLQERR